MRARNNYFPELETTAKGLLDAVGHPGGPLSQRVASDLASHLGFTLHYVSDLPTSTRSVTDLENGRIYLPLTQGGDTDQRSTLLQALAGHVLGLGEPRDYADFLLQRVQTNYLAGALMVPEHTAVAFLEAAKEKRELSVEDLRDAFAVTYETAAHRFTNLATQHLGIPVHFLKVHESGSISKAYENDNVQFPADAPRRGRGAERVPVLERTPRLRRRGPLQPVPPVHGQAHGHLLVHVTHPGHLARCLLGQRWHAVRPRQVVPRPGHHEPLRLHLPRRELLPHTARRPRAPLEPPVGAKPAPEQQPARGHAHRVFPGVDSTEVFQFLEAHAPGAHVANPV